MNFLCKKRMKPPEIWAYRHICISIGNHFKIAKEVFRPILKVVG